MFQYSFKKYLLAIPSLLRDTPWRVRRRWRNDFQELPDTFPKEYPAYYKRTFHWQMDGYMSERSDHMYDIGVEWLFLGTADIMRRQVIRPITRFGQGRETTTVRSPLRILGVACGTGHLLKQMAVAFPEASLAGVDLSPYYLDAARELLSQYRDISLQVENAEALSAGAKGYDVVTGVFLFHELPKDARRAVTREIFRVLRTGGIVVLADSAQQSDCPELKRILPQFTVEFHAPCYKGY